jgi:hypothetical protein
VTTQVNKVIQYEKLPEMGASWYSDATGIASAEGSGIGDDGESDIQHNNVIWNDKLDPFTFESFNSIYDPGASSSMVTAAVNSGTSLINYTGHGSMTSWGTTGFSNNGVAGLSNGDRMPWIISVACNNGDFHNGTCFAEAWLRKQDGGAIMMMAASISQPWAPPMRGQDYFMDILIGGYDYTAHAGQNGINTTEQRTTFGTITFNGLVLMCVESGGGSDWETAKTWNLFGDPSTQARTAEPAELTLSNAVIMAGIAFTTNISTSEGPLENAMVALSQDGAVFRGFSDANGDVTIDHALNPGMAKLVVTGFNTETIYDDVNVVPADGAYVVFSAYEINDASGNDNGQMDYAETVELTIGLTNVGTDVAEDVEVALASDDLYITLMDTNATFGSIPAGDTVFVADAFQVALADSVPDGHIVNFMLNINCAGGDNWTSSFGIEAHAPMLEFIGYQVDDPAGNNNGRLDPDENADLLVMVKNMGSAEAYNIIGNLSTDNEYITITGSPGSIGDLIPGDTGTYSFPVEVSPDAPAGDIATFAMDLAAEHNITAAGSFELYIGQIPVLVLDYDENHNSAQAIEQCLENLQITSDSYDVMPGDLNLYSSIFVCLGVYPNNHILSSAEGEVLADYLMAGGQIYMEGGDTWYYDQQANPTPVHDMFGLEGLSDGTGDLSILMGMAGSIAEGMEYQYTGDNSYIDHIAPSQNGVLMFENQSPVYGVTVSNDAGTYRTIGSSMEFGGLADGDYSKDDLMILILEFFGIEGIWTSVYERTDENNFSVSVYPNPVSDHSIIRLTTKKRTRVNMTAYNSSGQAVAEIFDGIVIPGVHEIQWDVKTDDGSFLTAGMYFLRITSDDAVSVQKLLLTNN